MKCVTAEVRDGRYTKDMIAAQFGNWWISSKPKVKVQSAILRKVDDGKKKRSNVFFVGERVKIATTLPRRETGQDERGVSANAFENLRVCEVQRYGNK